MTFTRSTVIGMRVILATLETLKAHVLRKRKEQK